MPVRKLLAGTKEHRQALYLAACDYQNGMSLETAARRHRVHANTLRSYLRREGWRIDTHRHYRGKVTCNQIPEAFLDAHPRLTPREIADACGVNINVVRQRLRERGNYKPRPVGAQPTSRWANSLRNRENVMQAVAMTERGLTQGQVAIRLGVSRSTVGTWLRQYRAGTFLWQREPIPEWLDDRA